MFILTNLVQKSNIFPATMRIVPTSLCISPIERCFVASLEVSGVPIPLPVPVSVRKLSNRLSNRCFELMIVSLRMLHRSIDIMMYGCMALLPYTPPSPSNTGVYSILCCLVDILSRAWRVPCLRVGSLECPSTMATKLRTRDPMYCIYTL